MTVTAAARATPWAATRLQAATQGGRLARLSSFRPVLKPSAEHAVGADPAVFHDRQAVRCIAAAAQAIGGVGKPVLMQRAGDEHGGQQRQQAGDEARPELCGQQQDQGSDQADELADERKIPRRCG